MKSITSINDTDFNYIDNGDLTTFKKKHVLGIVEKPYTIVIIFVDASTIEFGLYDTETVEGSGILFGDITALYDHIITVLYIPSDGGGGGDTSLTESVTVRGVGTVGAVSDGDILPIGQTFTDTMKQILQQDTAPNAGILVSPSATQEIGTILDYTITPTFVQNDGGAVGVVEFLRHGVPIHSQAGLTPHIDSLRTVVAGNTLYTVNINYAAGNLPAGVVSASRNVVGAYRNFYGPTGATPPTTSAEIRALSSSFSNTFTLNTGDTSLSHTIAIPATRTLVSVIDIDALNADLIASYVLDGTVTSVPDAGGTPVAYDVYVLTIAVPYSSNHRHNITIS